MIAGITGVRTFDLSPADGTVAGPIQVDLAEGAALLREGPVELDAFVAGDEVAVTGDLTATGSVLATGVESVYRLVDVEVTAREGATLETAEGDLVLDSDSQPQGGVGAGHEVSAEPLPELGAGDHVVALGRLDPEGSTLLVSRVGVVQD